MGEFLDASKSCWRVLALKYIGGGGMEEVEFRVS